MRYFNLIAALFLMPFLSLSQNKSSQLKGTLLDPDKSPVAYASVILLKQDTVFVKGEVSKDDGTFHFVGLEPDTYRLKVQSVEFNHHLSEPFVVSTAQSKLLTPILLEKSVTQLNEVVVAGSKNTIEVHPDKMVFNVATNIAATSSNGFELLSKAPGVMIDPDRNIQLMGKSGVRIFINGRPSRLSGADLANYLQSMSAENVESIEIITNPSARYEAEGKAGIINIKLKKNENEGFNGSASSNYSKGSYARTNHIIAFNYQKKKINLYSDLNYTDNLYQNDFTDTKEQNGYTLHLKAPGLNNNKGLNISTGIDYIINSKHSLSFNARRVSSNGNNQTNSLTKIVRDDETVPTEYLSSVSDQKYTSTNLNYNLNYQFDISQGSHLSADFSYGKIKNNQENFQPNIYYASDGISAIKEVNNAFNGNNIIDLGSGQIDYEKTINKMKLSAGTKYYQVKTGNDFQFYSIEPSGSVLDPNKSNYFTYLEKVMAGYAILNGNISEKLTLNIGARVESTNSLGELYTQQDIANSHVSRKYTNIFPNASLKYTAGSNSQFSVGIGRRISRPSYQDLNPFETKLSELAYFKGNPFLKPSYTWNYDIAYTYKNKLTIMNTYSITDDEFASILVIAGSKGTFLIPQNMQNIYANSTTVSYPITFAKWWEMSAVSNYYYSKISGNFENTSIQLNARIFNINLQNTFTLPGNIKASLNYFYMSPFVWRSSLRFDAISGVSFGLSKSLFHEQLQLRINGNDIFNKSSDYRYRGNYGGLVIDGIYGSDNRRFGITVVYKFGNQKMKNKGRKQSGLSEQLNRVKEN